MNLNELKPIWEAYKEQTNQQLHWSNDDLARIIQPETQPYPWLLNLCMTFLLVAMTGC